MAEPTIFEISSPGRIGVKYPLPDVPETPLPAVFVRDQLPLPELPVCQNSITLWMVVFTLWVLVP
jgi:hypothetical protein